MDKLFKDLEKTAEIGSFLLDSDSTQWVKQIIQHFLSEYPFLQNEPLSISWQKWAPEKGYAVGSLNLLNGVAPIIVNDYRVSPIDVIMWGNVTMPINKEILLRLNSDTNAFAGLMQTNKKFSESLFKTNPQFSPTSETNRQSEFTISRPAVKVASVLDIIEGVDKADAVALLKEAKEYIDQFKANNTDSVLVKLANLKYSDPKNNWLREVEPDRQLIIDLGDKYLVKQANSKINYDWEFTINKPVNINLENIFNKTIEKTPDLVKSSAQLKQIQPSVGETGIFKHADYHTEPVVIQKIAKIEKSDGKIAFPTEKGSIIIEKNTKNYSLKQASVQVPDHEWVLKNSELPKVGQVGVLYAGKEMYGPYEILSQSIIGNSHLKTASIELKVLPVNELTPQNIKISNLEFSNIGFKENTQKVFPKSTKWISLNKQAQLNYPIAEPIEYFVGKSLKTGEPVYIYKTAKLENINLQPNSVILPPNAKFYTWEQKKVLEKTANKKAYVVRDLNGFYIFSKEFEKIGCKTVDLNLQEAQWLLVKLGGTKHDFYKLNNLKPGESFYVEGKLDNPLPIEKIEQHILKTASNDKIYQLKGLQPKEIIKIAVHLREKSSVDSVLALGLLKKSNIMQYLAIIPQYEQILGELSKLLIASRLGLIGTNPDVIKQAQDTLAEVVLSLKAVEAAISDVK